MKKWVDIALKIVLSLILVTPILSTNGTSERRISDQDQEYSLLIRKRRHHTNIA